MDRIKQLEDKVNELESYFPDSDVVVAQVSKANVGWQVDHSLIVINKVYGMLEASKPQDYKWQFNFWRSYCFLRNWIPRGRAKAPRKVRPMDDITLNDLEERLLQVRENLARMQNLPAEANMRHHIFGYLNKKQTLKFLNMHTEHHLKIIRDILIKKSPNN